MIFYFFYTFTHKENFIIGRTIHQEFNVHGTKASFIRNPISTILMIFISINYDFFKLSGSFFNYSLGTDQFYSCVFIIIINFILIFNILKDKTTTIYDKKVLRYMILIFTIVLFGSYYGMYVGWVISDYFRIVGVQGRYLIPVGILIYMIFNSEKFRKSEAKDNSKLLFYSTVYISFFTVINFLICIMN